MRAKNPADAIRIEQRIVCRHCGFPIERRSEVRVVGRSLVPVHTDCQPDYQAVLPWSQRSWAINRWSSFLGYNAVLLLLSGALNVLRPDVSFHGIAQILLACNLWLLLGRLISYLSIERHIPTGKRARNPSGQ